MVINESRVFDLKYLCNRKWRLEHPQGYVGSSRALSTRAAAENVCQRAGLGTLEAADAYFKAQTPENRAFMLAQAKIAQAERDAYLRGQTPSEQANLQEWLRRQAAAGKEGAAVTDIVPKDFKTDAELKAEAERKTEFKAKYGDYFLVGAVLGFAAFILWFIGH